MDTDYSKLNDLQLVDHFKAGEEAAFTELFHRYKRKLVQVALRFSDDVQASEEIAHEVFIEIHQKIDRFQGHSKFYTYLYGIAHNKARKWAWQKRRRRETPLETEDEKGEKRESSYLTDRRESIRQIHDKNELAKLLQEALQKLPETARQVFILSEIQGLRYEEVAQTLGLSSTNVGWHLHEARRKLRELLPLEMLEVFYFSIAATAQGAWIAMRYSLENLKLMLGRPSSLLLSFYVDREVSLFQRELVEKVLERHEAYRSKLQDYQKIKLLFDYLEEPALDSAFDAAFERKLAGSQQEEKQRGRGLWPLGLPLPSPLRIQRALTPALAVLVAAISYWIAQPLGIGSAPLIQNIQGEVQVLDPAQPAPAWTTLDEKAAVHKGLRLRTLPGASAEMVLTEKMIVKLHENSEIQFEEILRSRQKGEFRISQIQGKTFIGLGPAFKGSEFTLQTPFGTARAYGTLFMVDVSPQTQSSRILVLDGHVEVQDLQRSVIETVIPQTERILTPSAVGKAMPILLEHEDDVKELQKLKVPGKILKVSTALDETLSLALIAGPDRIQEYLSNPRLITRRDFPILTEKVSQARKKMLEADQSGQMELYQEVIKDLESFSQNYLDPYGRFQPHLDFFIGTMQHFLGNHEASLASFAKVAKRADPSWSAMGHLARALLYEQDLKDPEAAKKEYQAVLSTAPDSPEAEAANKRLNPPAGT